MMGVLMFGIEFVPTEGLIHFVRLIDDGLRVIKALVEEVGDLFVLVDLLVSVEIRFEQLETTVSQFLEGWLHSGSEGSI